jgi:hypothetical protein
MNFSVQNKIQKLFFGILVAAAGSTQVANAGGLGLFGGSDCDSGYSTAACDGLGCGGPGCDEGCDSCLDSCGAGFMCGLIKPSDHCFDDFISPMINFVHFEDPRTLTELRPIFVNHWVPSTIGNNIDAGGSIQLMAVQFRVALTERLSLIGVKDGYIWDNTDGALDTLLDDGWASVTAGLKYNLLRNTQSGTLASVGATYELPVGSRSALQDVGDGEFHFFATGGQRFLDGNAHWLSAFGWRVPSDGFLQTESIHWSNHFDVKVTESLYLLTEFAWWHWTDSAEGGLPLGVAGQDLFNLPANDVTDNDLVTQNVGMKYKPSGKAEYGLAWEFPLTEFKDVIEGRLQAEVILRY